MIYIVGDGHLAYVTAVSIANLGTRVTLVGAYGAEGLDEPRLDSTLARLTNEGMLITLYDNRTPYTPGDIIWMCYDTPVAPDGASDIDWLNRKIQHALDTAPADTMVLISSQVPVGFASRVQDTYPHLRLVSAPENIRRGRALDDFWICPPVIGSRVEIDRDIIRHIYGLRPDIIWTSLESAELSKHLLNSFTGMCIAFANELQAVANWTGANYDEALLAARRDARLQCALPLRSGPADGRHFLRDIGYLMSTGLPLPVLDSVRASPIWES